MFEVKYKTELDLNNRENGYFNSNLGMFKNNKSIFFGGRLSQLSFILATVAVLSLQPTSMAFAKAPEKKISSKTVKVSKSTKSIKSIKSIKLASSSKNRVKVQLAKGKTIRLEASNQGQARKWAKASRANFVVTKNTPSFGELAGLRAVEDPLDLKSSVALVLDQDTREVLFRKNDSAVLPIASVTKLMTGLLISQAHLDMDELITITQADVDTEKGSSSRLKVNSTLTRGQLLHLALMSSENRAAHALGRTYPGGLGEFVMLMNARARLLGMKNTRYVEPTGLSSLNQSTAQDLAILVSVASKDTLVRQLSTSPSYEVEVDNKVLQYNTTNQLVKNPNWDIGLQKTGYIREAGQCLVMQAKISGRKLIMVFLDSTGKLSRIADANRVKRWIETTNPDVRLQSKSDIVQNFENQ